MKKKSVTWAAFPFLKRRLVALHGDERGVVAIMAAIMMVCLVGTLGLVVDLGYGYSQRRLAQNSADSAAIAGAKMVAVHIQYSKTTPKTDNDVRDAIMEVINRSPGQFQTGVEATYVKDTNNDGVPEPTGIYVGSLGTSPPPTGDPTYAVGVQVRPRRQNPTFFAPVLGPSAGTLTAQAKATAMARPVLGHNRLIPFTIWAGEAAHKCQPPVPVPTGNNVVGDEPPAGTQNPTGMYGCNVMTYRNPSPNHNLAAGDYVYHATQWIRHNIRNGADTAVANWWGTGSNEFKGYFHTGNTSSKFTYEIGKSYDYNVQGGMSHGTVDPDIQKFMQDCWNKDNATPRIPCTVVMPIVDFKSEVTTGDGGIRLRVSGFAEVKLLTNPSSNQDKIGRVVSLSTDYDAIVGPTCPAADTCQQAVKLVD